MHSLERESGASGVGIIAAVQEEEEMARRLRSLGIRSAGLICRRGTQTRFRQTHEGNNPGPSLCSLCSSVGAEKVSKTQSQATRGLQVDTSDLGSEEVSFPVSLPPLSLPLMASALTHYYRDSSPRSTQSTQHHSDALRRPLRHSPHTAAVVGLVGLAADADESPVVVVGRQWCVRKPPRHRCQHAMSSRPPGSHQKRAHAHTRSGRCGWPFTH